jgi:hypothetical protein
MVQHGETYRIDRRPAHRVILKLFCASTTARQPGGTSTVELYSTKSAGPRSVVPDSRA